MEELDRQVQLLYNKKNTIAYQALQALQKESERSDEVYSYLNHFWAMLDHKNSYVRTRGLLLIAANVQWDQAGKIDDRIDLYLQHIMDEKPITARQCIQCLSGIALCKPALKGKIITALKSADLTNVTESMAPLIAKDIKRALQEIAQIEHP